MASATTVAAIRPSLGDELLPSEVVGTRTAFTRLAPDANVVNEVPGQAGLFDLIHGLHQPLGDFENAAHSVNPAIAPKAFIMGLNRSSFLPIDPEPVGK